MTEYDDLHERKRELVDELRGEDLPGYELSERLGIAASTVRDHIYDLEKVGYDIEYNPAENTWTLLDEPSSVGDVETPAESEPADDPRDDTEDDSPPSLDNLPSGLITDLSRGGLTFQDFEEEYGLSDSQAKRLLQNMRESGYAVDFKEVDEYGTRLWFFAGERDKKFSIGDGDGQYTFAIISDTHLGSKAEHLDELNDFYDEVQRRGIDIVFHAGDIGDGWNVHKGQIDEVKGAASGWDRLTDYVVDNYPQRDGVDTLFISGNHDHKLQRRTGIWFSERIDERRDDLHWCGDSQATFVFDRENDINLELIHPSGGNPYTVGYRLQTLYRERPVDNRPTIAAVGHIHGSMYAETEGVKGLYAGCWKGLTTYGKRKGHVSNIGGWIIDMKIEDGEIRQFTPQWVGYSSNEDNNNFDLQDIDDMIAGD